MPPAGSIWILENTAQGCRYGPLDKSLKKFVELGIQARYLGKWLEHQGRLRSSRCRPRPSICGWSRVEAKIKTKGVTVYSHSKLLKVPMTLS